MKKKITQYVFVIVSDRHLCEADADVVEWAGNCTQQDLGAPGPAQPSLQGDFCVSGEMGVWSNLDKT